MRVLGWLSHIVTTRVLRCRLNTVLLFALALAVLTVLQFLLGLGSVPRWDSPRWQHTRQLLCPGQRPNLHLAGRVFRAGQQALGLPAKDDGTAHRFHSFLASQVAFLKGQSLVVFQAVWKCANTQARKFLRGMLVDQSLPHVGLESDIPNERDVQRFITHAEAAHPHLQKCGVVLLRDPISHFLSGYNHIEHQRWDRIRAGNKTGSSWKRDDGLRHVNMSIGEKRFVAFVRGLIEGEWERNHVYYGAPSYHHVSLMSGMLPHLHNVLATAPQGPSKVRISYGDSTRIMEELPRLLRDACGLDAAGIPEMELMGQHNSSNDALGSYQAAQNVVMSGPSPTLDALCIIHAMDYACFHDQFEVPLMCRDALDRLDLGGGLGDGFVH